MTSQRMDLDLWAPRLAVCRLAADAGLPTWVDLAARPLVCVARTEDELSIVHPEHLVPDEVEAERGWRALSVRGPLAFELTGILASLAAPLADAAVPIFAISTHDTDWLLVPELRLQAAVSALENAGHRVERPGA
jgi:uncharacterized protein